MVSSPQLQARDNVAFWGAKSLKGDHSLAAVTAELTTTSNTTSSSRAVGSAADAVSARADNADSASRVAGEANCDEAAVLLREPQHW
jgi:hypothetical protein